jgi:transcriptional regulator with XRE-family HTH domain
MIENILGTRLREIRTEAGLTIKDVSISIGLSPMAYNHYEWGDREPSLDVLRKLCDLFNVSSDYLIGRSDDY